MSTIPPALLRTWSWHFSHQEVGPCLVPLNMDKVILGGLLGLFQPRVTVTPWDFQGWVLTDNAAPTCFAGRFSLEPDSSYISSLTALRLTKQSTQRDYTEWRWDNVNMLQNESGPTVRHLHTQYSQKSIERKGAFNQNVGNLERWWTQHPLKTTSEDSARPWKFLKGNRSDLRVAAIRHYVQAYVQACWLLVIFL